MDAELATPVDTQTCVVRRLLENAFLLKGKTNKIQDYQSNLLIFLPTERQLWLTLESMDILSYDDSNYSGGSRGEYRVIRPPLLPPKIEAPRAEKVFLETVLRPLPAFPPPPPPTPLIWRSGSGTELYLFNNAFVWYSGTSWVKLTISSVNKIP